MSADDAFARLMRENRLAIPVAEVSEAPAPRRAKPATEVMRVKPGDFGPPGGGAGKESHFPELDAGEAFSARRDTEVDLDAVPSMAESGEGDSELAEALDEGAHIVRRDPAFTGDAEPISESIHQYADGAPLDGARRVRRFAYLPLAGADSFEASAMELAVNLTDADPNRPSLLLVSAARGAGRTEVAMRLALTVAKRTDSRVLLADFDMKNPQIAARFGLAVNYFALADVLAGGCPLREACIASDEDGLYVLPALRSDPAGYDMADSRRIAEIMAEIHAAFGFAVIDSGPVERGEVRMLCRQVGAAAIVGYRGLTTARQMKRTAAAAEAAGARVAGMILAGM